MEMNDEEVRIAVLEFFYIINKTNPNIFHAPQFAANRLKIDWRRVVSACQLLSDEGFLKKEKDKYGVKYRISSKGVARFSPSQFVNSRPYSSLVVHQNGGISIIGNSGNIGNVSNNVLETYQEIDKLIDLLVKSTLESNNKLQLVSEAEILKAELTKPQSDKSALKKSWDAIKIGAGVINDSSEVAQAILKIGAIILPLIS